MLVRMFTENLNRGQVEHLVGLIFPGFTTYEARGWWRGTQEESLVIEIAQDKAMDMDYVKGQVQAIAAAIRKLNGQESVMVQFIDCEIGFY